MKILKPETVKNGCSMKSVGRKLIIGAGKMYAATVSQGDLICNFDDIGKHPQNFIFTSTVDRTVELYFHSK